MVLPLDASYYLTADLCLVRLNGSELCVYCCGSMEGRGGAAGASIPLHSTLSDLPALVQQVLLQQQEGTV